MKYYYFDEAFLFVVFLDVADFDAVAGFFASEDFLLTVAFKTSERTRAFSISPSTLIFPSSSAFTASIFPVTRSMSVSAPVRILQSLS